MQRPLSVRGQPKGQPLCCSAAPLSTRRPCPAGPPPVGWELQDRALGQHSVLVPGAGGPADDPGLLVLVEPMSMSANHSPDPVPASQADETRAPLPLQPPALHPSPRSLHEIGAKGLSQPQGDDPGEAPGHRLLSLRAEGLSLNVDEAIVLIVYFTHVISSLRPVWAAIVTPFVEETGRVRGLNPDLAMFSHQPGASVSSDGLLSVGAGRPWHSMPEATARSLAGTQSWLKGGALPGAGVRGSPQEGL